MWTLGLNLKLPILSLLNSLVYILPVGQSAISLLFSFVFPDNNYSKKLSLLSPLYICSLLSDNVTLSMFPFLISLYPPMIISKTLLSIISYASFRKSFLTLSSVSINAIYFELEMLVPKFLALLILLLSICVTKKLYLFLI